MAIERSDEFILAALFLARCGRRVSHGTTLPPAQLRTNEWNVAYAAFYDALAGGRPLRVFHNSLKATRDQFDSHLDTGRRGWWEGDKPKPLPERDARVFERWRSRSDDELWQAVSRHADPTIADVPGYVLRDLEVDTEPPRDQQVRVGREGALRAVISTRRERSPRLRAEAFKRHGHRCQVCDFSFEEAYGEWGAGFAEVHHLELLADAPSDGRKTDPAADLAVLCSNCHRMVHRRPKQVLTLEELRQIVAEARR